MAGQSDNFGSWLAVGVVVLILLLGVSYFFFPLLGFTEEREAGAETVEQTYDAEQAIQQYEEFRELYAEIEEERNQIENNKEALQRFYNTYGEDPDEWSRTTKERHSRLQTRITASQQQLEGLVADYNAESSKANAEVFKCQLPYQVDERLDIGGPPGSDEAEQPIQDETIDGKTVNGEVPPAEECNGLPDKIDN